MPVLDDLQELSALWSRHQDQDDIIDEQDFGLEQFFHELWVRAVCYGDGEFLEQARQPDVVGLEAHPASSVCQRAGEIGFTHPSGTPDDDVLVIGNPFTLSQVEETDLSRPRGVLKSMSSVQALILSLAIWSRRFRRRFSFLVR